MHGASTMLLHLLPLELCTNLMFPRAQAMTQIVKPSKNCESWRKVLILRMPQLRGSGRQMRMRTKMMMGLKGGLRRGLSFLKLIMRSMMRTSGQLGCCLSK
jgi:hypothetical protein